MKTIRKFWWLALIAGGWLLVQHAHADQIIDTFADYSKMLNHFDGQILKISS